ncbi:MAG: hypothetical protein NZM41_13990 [Saprospiraceae bacterium]|nr:hypothetical protein [Saprospiraceae bacterium]
MWGWSKAYPETTGYLIPTLLAWGDAWANERCYALARRLGRWLVNLQQPTGAWAGGIAGGRRPSVFNTAMIADGLAALAARTPDETDAADSARRGLIWLLSAADADGVWRRGLYVPGFVPTYHAYAVASVLRAADRLSMPEVQMPLRRALAYYADRFRADGTLALAGLEPGPWAFTHTLTYALQGLWEAAVYFQEKNIQQKVVFACQNLQEAARSREYIAGRYREGWKGDYSFTCPVGNAQLSVLFRAIGTHTGDASFSEWADRALAATVEHQCRSANPNTHGALPGSVPRWGPYLRWRYPNWGAKFLLDALHCALMPGRIG